ncbi:MAG TPA: hypothetical protein DCS82_06900, partial [Rhodospirillaceae bacterium]|nr:hypothetical protein [Rhodospirillaceae bacterium]
SSIYSLRLAAFEAMIEANEPSDRPDLCVNFEELNSMLDVEFLDELEERYAVGGDKRAAE